MIEKIYDTWPEIYRETKAGLSKSRMITGLVAITAVSILIYSVNFNPDAPGFTLEKASQDYLRIAGSLQVFMLIFFGLSQSIRSIADEKMHKTWDFQRLTPLGSWRMVTGKILASLIFPSFLFLCFLPGEFFVLWINPDLSSLFLATLLQYIVTAYAAVSIGLLVSAHTERHQRGTMFLVFLAAYLVIPNVMFRSTQTTAALPVRFLFWEISHLQWITITSFLAGIWGMLGAKWRVGKDLLEGSRFWRMPAFIAFLYTYAASFTFRNRSGEFESNLVTKLTVAAIFIPVFVYLLSLFDPASRSRFKTALNPEKSLRERLDSLPVWVLGCASVLLSTIFIYIASLLSSPRSDVEFWRVLSLLPLFLVRDCMIFQLLAWMRVRTVANLALLITTLLYLIPALFLRLAFALDSQVQRLFPVFLPVIPEDSSVSYAFLPILLEIALVAFFLVQQFDRASQSTAAKEI